MSEGETYVIALVKDEEQYIFLYNDESRAETLRTLGRYASNSELSFSWYDSAMLSQKVRRSVDGPESKTGETLEEMFNNERQEIEDDFEDPLA